MAPKSYRTVADEACETMIEKKIALYINSAPRKHRGRGAGAYFSDAL